MTVRYRDVGGTSCLLQWLRRSILRNSFYSTRSHILGESNLTSLLRLEQSANQLSATEFFFRNQKITETFQKFLVSSSLRSKRRECDGAEQRTCTALPDNCLPGDLDLICARTHTHTYLMLPTWTSELVGNLTQTADTSCLWQTPTVISIFATNHHRAPSWTRFSPHTIPHFLYIHFNITLLSTSRCSMQPLPHAFPSQCVLHAPAISSCLTWLI